MDLDLKDSVMLVFVFLSTNMFEKTFFLAPQTHV
jgi:hypothetical protein